MDLSQAYWNHVFQPSLDQWTDGLTPNPDVFCNRCVLNLNASLWRLLQISEVKFGALMKSAPVRSSRWLATGSYSQPITQSDLTLRTGHYARIGWNSDDHPRPKLLRAKDRTKDQTYYLSNISENALQKVFPDTSGSSFANSKPDSIPDRGLAQIGSAGTCTGV